MRVSNTQLCSFSKSSIISIVLLLTTFFLNAQTPSINCTFQANLPIVPCASTFSATISYSNLPVNTTVNFIFPNTVSLGIQPPILSTPIDNGQLYSASFSFTGSSSFTIPMILSTCNMNGSEPIYQNGGLIFDCIANNTLLQLNIPVTLGGPSGSTFQPDNGGIIEMSINNSPILLTATPPSEQFTQLFSPGSRTFTIDLNPAVSSFIWNYSPEDDITQTLVPAINNGSNQVSNLPFINNQLTLQENYEINNCVGNGGVANITIECPNDCPDIVRNVNVNAFMQNSPPVFSVSAPVIVRPENKPDGCSQEYIFEYQFSISPAQPITLHDLIIPINQEIYQITDIIIDENSIGTSFSSPIILSNENGFNVKIKTNFICSYFQYCYQRSNLLYDLFEGIHIEYSRACIDGISIANLNVPNANAGQEFLGTLLGGPQEIDYSNNDNSIPVMYEFMTSTGLQFGLDASNDCDVNYQIVITATDGFNQPVGIGTDGTSYSNQITLPINNLVLEQYSYIDFNLFFQNCPYDNLLDNPLFPASGPVILKAEVQAFCPSCPSCYRSLRCLERTITAHCTGDCQGPPVGTSDSPQKPEIKRITYGWQNATNYINELPALTSLTHPNPIVLNQQLITFYPYDIFELTAYGNADAGQQIGFEIAYPDIDGIEFQFIEGKIAGPTDNFNILDDFQCFNSETITGDVFGYNDVEKLRIWYNQSCPGANLTNFKIVARFRVFNSRPVGFIENEFRLQYISRIGNSEANQSCDSYGYRLTFLSPDYNFENYTMPIQTAAATVDLNVKNNPIITESVEVANRNVDLCRTTAGTLVSGYGAKGGNSPDFRLEYRPMIDWPSAANFPNLVRAESFVQSNNIYLNPETIKDPSSSVRFLPPIKASNNFNNVNGVYLEFKGDCANEDFVPIVSDNFRFYHHAYVNDASFKLETDPNNPPPPIYPTNSVFHEIPFSTDQGLTASLNFDFNTILTTPTYSLNGNVYNLPISINQAIVPAGTAILENLLIYYYLTNEDGSALAPGDNSSIGMISDYASNLTSQMSGINPTGYSYYFNSAISTSLPGNIPISLACNDHNYKLVIKMLHFCDENGFSQFTSSEISPCQIITRTLDLISEEPTSVESSSSIQLVNDPITGECYLEWTATITNPEGEPEIVNPNFIFNSPNGLILIGQSLNFTNASGNSIPVSIANPIFELEAMAPPFNGNFVASFNLSPTNPSFIFEAGGELVYKIRFKFSSNLCNSGTDGFNLLGRLVGSGRCSAVGTEINLTTITQSMPSSPTPSSSCCVPSPIDISVIHACPGQEGQITFIPQPNISLEGTTYSIIGIDGVIDAGQITSSTPNVTLPLGFYAVLITLSNGNQMSFTANIQSGEISPTLTILNNTVCQNTTFTGTILDNNPVNTGTYTYSWIGPNPSTSIVSATNTFTTNNPSAGEYSVTITNDINGCSNTQTFDIFVDMPPSTAVAGVMQNICTGSTQLDANTPSVGTGNWSGAGLSFLDAALPNTTVSGLSIGENILTWTTSNGICANSTSEVVINVLTNPNIDAGPDQSVCGTTATLAANNLQNGQWTIVNGSGTFSNPNLYNTVVTGLAVGTNTFRWTFNNGVCGPISDDVTITSMQNPTTASAGLDLTICEGSIATLNGNTPIVGIGNWSTSSISAIITNSLNATSTVTGLTPGTHTLTWTLSNAPCIASSDDVIVTVDPVPNAGSDEAVCSSTTTLAAIPTNGGAWSSISGSGIIDNSQLANTSVTGLSTGPNVFRWTVTNACGTAVYDEVTITSVLNPTTSSAGLDINICEGSIATLNGNTPIVGIGNWSTSSSSANIDNASNATSTVSGLTPGNHTLEWTISNAPCSASSDQVIITVQATPTSNAGSDQTVCGSTTTLDAIAANAGAWSLVSGGGIINTPSSESTTVSNLDYGDNEFKWSISNGVCEPISDNVIITRATEPTISMILPLEMCNTQSFDLIITPEGGNLTYNGISINGISTDPINISGADLQIGENTFSYDYTDVNGCTTNLTQILNVTTDCICSCPSPFDIRYEVPATVTTSDQLMVELGSTNTISNRCLKFNESLTILANTNGIIFENCDLSFDAGTELIVAPNASLRVSSSTLHGCDAMWAGIKNNGRALIKSSLIRDARIGFEMVRIQTEYPSTSLIGVTFSNNFIGLSNSWQIGNHSFKGPIDCFFTGGPLLPAYTNQIPAPNPLGGYTGIRVVNKFRIIIDETNKFKNLYNGIIIFNSSAKIDKAIFSNIQYDPSNLLYPNNSYSNVQSIMNFGNHPNFPSAAVNVAARSSVFITGLGTDENEPNVMFYGCRNSITNHQSILMVKDVRIDGEDDMPSDIGIHILSNINGYGFNVSDNRIRAKRSGVVMEECGNFIGSSEGLIHNNNITILDNYDLSQPDVISLNSFKFGIRKTSQLNSSAIKLSENTINIQSWQPSVGISANQSPGIQVLSNLVRRYTPSIGVGIGIENNQGATLSCNQSIGMDSDVMNVWNEAFTIWNSTLTLNDNYSNLTQTGFSFNENCAGITIANNEMANHTYNPNTTVPSGGLYLGLNADISDQTDMYNRFTTPNSWAVKHIDNTSNNLFFIDPSYQSAQFYPPHDPANLSDCTSDPFFVCESNQNLPPLPADPCGTSITGSTILGMAIANPGGTIGLAEAAAKREISYPVFNEESRFSLEKTLELGLKEGSLNLPDTGFFISWKDSLYASNASKLNDYSRTIHAENVDSAHIQLAIQWKSAAQLAFDSSMTWLSDINEVEDFETEIWLQRQIQLNILQSDADSLQEELKIADENRILSIVDGAEAKNLQVTMERDFEVMERTINEIYLQTLALGIFDYTAEQWSSISYIAWQCPLKSASAVYKARGMYGIVEPFTRFDNYSICASQGMQYRLAQEKPAEKIIEHEKFIVYPNPNAGLLQIEMNEIEGIAQFEILNTLGQIVLQWQNSDTKQTLDLSKLQMSSGMYYIRVKQVEGTSIQQKFIYQKQ